MTQHAGGTEALEVVAHGDGGRLGGTLWRPGAPPRGLVLMHPGSGPSDRDNDVFFPPIRAALLSLGVAVCSFDKRGVGASTGDWREAGISAQADDLAASLTVVRQHLPAVPVGLFGHSQGGWVVLEAARPTGADFVVASSGPAVTPREQEISSTESRLRRLGWSDERVAAGVRTVEAVLDATREPYARVWPQVRELPLVDELRDAGVYIPDEPGLWHLTGAILDHDPAPALRALPVPLLAVLGGADSIVPVARCAELYAALVRPDLLTLRVVPDADHRFGPVGAPARDAATASEAFVPDYLPIVTTFVAEVLDDEAGRPA